MSAVDPRPVLVAYASKHGATAEIAEAIAAAMQDAGCHAEARPVAHVHDLSGYCAVVLGSAVYTARWRKDARRFAARHRAELRQMPVWLFSSGPLGTPEDIDKAAVPPRIGALVERLGAREHVTFGGRVPLDPSNFVERAMLKNTPPERRDARDWAAIAAWAHAIAVDVRRNAPVPVPV